MGPLGSGDGEIEDGESEEGNGVDARISHNKAEGYSGEGLPIGVHDGFLQDKDFGVGVSIVSGNKVVNVSGEKDLDSERSEVSPVECCFSPNRARDSSKCGVFIGAQSISSVRDWSSPTVKVSRDVTIFFDVSSPAKAAYKIPSSCTSLFVGNVPHSSSSHKLRSLFVKFGTVVDVFIPQKTSKVDAYCFTFVRFRWEEDAVRAIEGLDGAVLEGYHLVVNVARFCRVNSKQPIPMGVCKGVVPSPRVNMLPNPPLLQVFSGNPSYAHVVQSGVASSGASPSVRNKVCEPSMDFEWLKCVAVGLLHNGLVFSAVKSCIISSSGMLNDVSFLGGSSCLLIFSSEGSHNLSLSDSMWNLWLISLEPWKDESSRGVSRLWVSCVGVPVAAWNLDSFSLISQVWGKIIKVDENISNQSQLVTARLFIESNLRVIDDCLDLVVGGISFKVFVSSSLGSLGSCVSDDVELGGSRVSSGSGQNLCALNGSVQQTSVQGSIFGGEACKSKVVEGYGGFSIAQGYGVVEEGYRPLTSSDGSIIPSAEHVVFSNSNVVVIDPEGSSSSPNYLVSEASLSQKGVESVFVSSNADREDPSNSNVDVIDPNFDSQAPALISGVSSVMFCYQEGIVQVGFSDACLVFSPNDDSREVPHMGELHDVPVAGEESTDYSKEAIREFARRASLSLIVMTASLLGSLRCCRMSEWC